MRLPSHLSANHLVIILLSLILNVLIGAVSQSLFFLLVFTVLIWGGVYVLLRHIDELALKQKTLEQQKAEAELQREQAQMEIWQMAERFEMLFLSNLDGVFVINRHGVAEVNHAAQSMFAAKESGELLNRKLKDFFPRHQPDGSHSFTKFLKELKTCIRKGRHRFEFEFQKMDGSRFPAEVVVNNMHLEEGFMLQMMLRDISARKHAESELLARQAEQDNLIKELKETQASLVEEVLERQSAEHALIDSRAMLSSVIQSALDGIIMMDGQGEIELWNPAASNIFGYTESEALGRILNDLIQPDTGNKKETGIDLTLAGSANLVGKTVEVITRDNQGETFPVEVSITSTQRNGQWHAVAVIRDITERKEAEKKLLKEQEEQRKLIQQLEHTQSQLLQSEKMAAIGQLAAGVAHEINNPTGFVASNLNTLGKYFLDIQKLIDEYQEAEKQLPADIQASLVKAKKTVDLEFLLEDISALLTESKDGIQRVKHIVQDLKDFSHVDEGEWLVVDVHKGMDSTLNVVWNEIKYKAEVIKNYAELPSIETIPSQLNQVFLNILVNAAQAMDSFGTITISSGIKDDQHVWLSIRDTGNGISEENLKRIFEPFFTTKPVGQGTGLGLSLVFGIMKKLGGHIDVESTVGVGTCFTIHLPIKREVNIQEAEGEVENA
ncbi:PAS domain S-box protein [Leeia sp. TBRC 13508]|uniref:histidine kinase n=1 Tax=Leeia speluncae TaxID=2884804 RepID=A0ABS8D8P7_9NEIS|nr:PAS domain S-box protein [Leeia speluncae]MCB6184598.1 PAS domain S-box protein [Leeia speluncae]